MSIHQYYDKLPEALMAFQYLEGALKFYIRDCDRMIQKSVKDSFHYSVREKDIEKMPLGRLIDEFSRRSNRTDLASALKKLNKNRNFVAHSAYIMSLRSQEDSAKMQELSQKIEKVTEAARACFKELAREHSRATKEPISQEILDMI